MLERMHLLILHEVNRLGSLTAAAQSLCLTQSALSHAIRKLEQHLETPVWTREGRQLRLTQTGEYLLSVARRVLPQLEHTEVMVQHYARGERGSLRIGMECHPCYRWLLKVVAPYLRQWPDVDVDVKQRFQFGGMAALLHVEIDILVTPDPVVIPGLQFYPALDYEQVLVVNTPHVLSGLPWVEPDQVAHETLITYPVAEDRLDIYRYFLTPAGINPKRHKTIEATDIMLQMVASGRGVAALPRWLVDEYASRLPIVAVRLGPQGMYKKIFLGVRNADQEVSYLQEFIKLAQQLSVGG
ncbi:MAG: LysR family transcriptional regulator [Pseudomonadales bacterium]|nr:LysR family transcriptional regulator [Pseudomonadales bacterium]